MLMKFFNDLINQLVEEKEVLVADQPNKNYDAEIGSFRALAGDFNADMLKALLDQTVSGGGVEIEPIVLSPSSDKSHRTVSLEKNFPMIFCILSIFTPGFFSSI